MKILKYTFEIPRLVVENNELIEMGTTQETYTFTLLFKGVDLFEKISGRPLLTEISKYKEDSAIDIEMVKNLARASYVNIEGDKFHQNMITAEDFAKTQAFSRIGTDVDFMYQLMDMVIDCCLSESQKQAHRANASKK